MTAIRLSPSGPVIGNTSGGPFNPGPGARLRLSESENTMGGTVAVPTTQSTLCTDGFGGVSPIIQTLNDPDPGLNYRAELRLDLFNVSSSHNCIVCLYLESSVDGGSTWTTRAKNAHVIQPQLGVGTEDNGQAREASVVAVLTQGVSFGVLDASASIKFRGSARLVTGSLGDTEVSSLAEATETSLNGTIHLLLEECF